MTNKETLEQAIDILEYIDQHYESLRKLVVRKMLKEELRNIKMICDLEYRCCGVFQSINIDVNFRQILIVDPNILLCFKPGEIEHNGLWFCRGCYKLNLGLSAFEYC